MKTNLRVILLGLLLGAGVSIPELVGGITEEPETPPVLQLGDVRFPHGLHFGDLEFECSECHHETNAAGLAIPHEEYFADFWINCKTCHRDTKSPVPAQSCSNCHHGSPTDIADETLSTKVVVHRSCWRCHEVGTGQPASRTCKSCHSGLQDRAAGTGEAAGEVEE